MKTFWLFSNGILGVQNREVSLYHYLLKWRRTEDKNIYIKVSVKLLHYPHTAVCSKYSHTTYVHLLFSVLYVTHCFDSTHGSSAITDRACPLGSYFDKHHIVAYSTYIVCSAHRNLYARYCFIALLQ